MDNRLILNLAFMALLGIVVTPLETIAAPSESSPVEVKNFVIIGPENSKAEFIGTHVGDDPNRSPPLCQKFRH